MGVTPGLNAHYGVFKNIEGTSNSGRRFPHTQPVRIIISRISRNENSLASLIASFNLGCISQLNVLVNHELWLVILGFSSAWIEPTCCGWVVERSRRVKRLPKVLKLVGKQRKLVVWDFRILGFSKIMLLILTFRLVRTGPPTLPPDPSGRAARLPGVSGRLRTFEKWVYIPSVTWICCAGR